jgi:hypothetical protein
MSNSGRLAIIDTNVQDPRISHKNISGKHVILNYKPTIPTPTFVYPNAIPQESEQFTYETPNVVSTGIPKFTYETPNVVSTGIPQIPAETSLPDEIPYIENPEHYCSVVVNAETKRPLSVAPSVPIPLYDFLQKYPVGTDHIQVNMMNEGTLIQLFYDTTANEWQIATKGTIGGNNRHYRTEYPGYTFRKQKTFREMFYDALTQVSQRPYADSPAPDVDLEDGLRCNLLYCTTKTYYDMPLSSIPYIQSLNKSCCYSYLVAHPSNPVTNVVFTPTITLIAVCEIMPYDSNGTTYYAHNIPQEIFAEMIPANYKNIVRVQRSFDWRGKSLEEEALNFLFMNDNNPGVMFTNIHTGERAVLENVSYTYTAQLRGNHPNLQFQFFELRCLNRLGEFLTRFPVFNDLFVHFFQQYCEFTFQVYSTYVQYYVHKKAEYKHTPYFKYASNIHRDIFIEAKRNGYTTIITREIVQYYFDTMSHPQLFGIMNSLEQFTYETPNVVSTGIPQFTYETPNVVSTGIPQHDA